MFANTMPMDVQDERAASAIAGALELVRESGPFKMDRKFNDSDVVKTYQQAAETYAYFYMGDFDYLVSMRTAVMKWQRLSTAQARGVLNCMAAELRRTATKAAAAAAQAEQPLECASEASTWQAPTGKWTLLFAEDEPWFTVRIKELSAEQLVKYQKPAGTRVLQYLSGSDNDTAYTGFAWMLPDRVVLWKKFQDNAKFEIACELVTDRERFMDAGQAYALASNNCYKCGHTLTVPASICAGLGPICAGTV